MRRNWTDPQPHEVTAHTIRVCLADINKPQYWLAAQLGVAPSTVNRKMSGLNKWKPLELRRMAEIFNIDVAELQPIPNDTPANGQAAS